MVIAADAMLVEQLVAVVGDVAFHLAAEGDGQAQLRRRPRGILLLASLHDVDACASIWTTAGSISEAATFSALVGCW